VRQDRHPAHAIYAATVLYGAGDVRVENVPDAGVIEPTDALVGVRRAAICGSGLWAPWVCVA
jgi:threonine dehydrogenase-like Zn-dependent dehydrogenase